MTTQYKSKVKNKNPVKINADLVNIGSMVAQGKSIHTHTLNLQKQKEPNRNPLGLETDFLSLRQKPNTT